jgi:hypothetical protein
MARKPRIPMLHTELPQQRLYLVTGMPERPAIWSTTLGMEAEGLAPSSMPRSARYVGQVEWAWSPMHMRIDAYYLSMCTHHRHWVLWIKGYDDNWSRWMDPQAVAAGPRAGLNADAATRLMLRDYWAKAREAELDRFHWVNEGGILDACQLAEVAAVVWGDADGEPEEQQEADL